MKRITLALCMLGLAACAPRPVPTEQLLPNPIVYGQTSSQFYLREKLQIGTIDYQGKQKEYLSQRFKNFEPALTQALEKGHYLSPAKPGAYTLSGTVLDLGYPSCAWGACESGSSVHYVLTRTKDQRVAWEQTLVVPFTMDAPVLMNNTQAAAMQIQTQNKAMGANIAHLIQVLNRIPPQ